jgi:hypothetical protein
MFQDMALLKPPMLGREKPWHQDHAYFDYPLGTPIVGVWIALDEATVENGCMQFLPGQHRDPIIHFQRRDWQICDSTILGRESVAAPLKPGGILAVCGPNAMGGARLADDLAEMLAQGYHTNVRAAIVACGERAFKHGLTSMQMRKVPVSKLLARLQAKMADDVIPVAEPAEPETAAVPADDAPPNREEMLQQAQILGIKADKRWSDATLMAKINEAMNPI